MDYLERSSVKFSAGLEEHTMDILPRKAAFQLSSSARSSLKSVDEVAADAQVTT